MMRSRFRIGPLLGILAVFATAAMSQQDPSLRKPAPGAKVRPDVEAIMWWLPPDTQTLEVDQSTLTVRAKEDWGMARTTLEDNLRSTSLGMFGELRDGEFLKALEGRVVLLAVEGSRRFRKPTGLGIMPFDGAQIFRLGDLGKSGPALVASLKRSANRVDSIGGELVAVFEERFEEDPWTIYVALIENQILICATSRNTMADVLLRKAKRPEHRALPAFLPEWKYLDPNVGFWAIRHYDPKDASDDPSSPMAEIPLFGVNSQDNQAIGLVFGSEKKRARVVYVSANPKSLDMMRSLWSRFSPHAKRLDGAAIELEFEFSTKTINDERAMYDFFSMLYTALGHGIWL